jgi:hypothetical protein
MAAGNYKFCNGFVSHFGRNPSPLNEDFSKMIICKITGEVIMRHI